jgi:hypothetical protein
MIRFWLLAGAKVKSDSFFCYSAGAKLKNDSIFGYSAGAKLKFIFHPHSL